MQKQRCKWTPQHEKTFPTACDSVIALTMNTTSEQNSLVMSRWSCCILLQVFSRAELDL